MLIAVSQIGDENLFHGFIAVAPLKQIWSTRRSSTPMSFHGFIAVAPLKQDRVERRPFDPEPLPRLHRRGPIEAKCLEDKADNRSLLFHGFIAVAPLKLESRYLARK